ncbi:PHD finger protein ALFIN-LIKE 6-like [Photinus pyralis]|uniref:PHD finger protein ALFIN-LIKE 6-like n=1 Tax=Photinus pyralis TaxID=7054 RepID=UPI0012675756|nr:PHD finger protein ALFIN-LIKE 6-like [Photinus pyralis]
MCFVIKTFYAKLRSFRGITDTVFGITRHATKRRKQKSEILTSTPFKATLEEKQRKREAKEATLERRATKKQKPKKKSHVRKVFDSSSEDEIDESKLCDDDELDDMDSQNMMDFEGNEGESCLVCGEYGKDEIWYRCVSCGGWVHKMCSGKDSAVNYICDVTCS